MVGGVREARDRAHRVFASAEGTSEEEVRSLTGRGAQATIKGIGYAVGGPALLRELDGRLPDALVRATESWSARGAAVQYLIRPGPGVVGALALEDEVRPPRRGKRSPGCARRVSGRSR
jgi:cation transport ATPase